jgi:hypothetical protein
MACNQQIKLHPIVAGDTWDGLRHTCSSDGTAFASPLALVEMSFSTISGTVGLALSSADAEIAITGATAWTFTVEPVTPFSLAVGVWYWSLTCTDTDGVVKTRLSGTKTVTKKA